MNSNKQLIRYLIWAYFLLIILEGALRKWVLPGLATPLLVVRDPIAVLIFVLGLPYLLKNTYALVLIAFGAFCIPLALATGHGSLPVALFGARILILHLPIIFIFPAVFDREDVWQFAKATLLITLGMTALLILQYSLPQSHFVNIGIGGEGSSGFSAALGRYRSSGTFAFTNGVSLFYALSATVFAAWVLSGSRKVPLWIWASAACLLLSVPLSISRSLAFSYGLIGLFVLLSGGVSSRNLGRMGMAGLLLLVILLPLSQTPIFQDSLEAFQARWEMATEAEGEGEGVQGVLENRVLGGFTAPFEQFKRLPLVGYGIGIGTQAGTFLYFGRRGFLLGEGEWVRTIGELGFVLGFLYLGLRLWMAVLLGLKALNQLRAGNVAPFILTPMPAIWLIMGDTGQPTALGFLVVAAGLWAASFVEPPAMEAELSAEEIREENGEKVAS